jgi:hypothetical protein
MRCNSMPPLDLSLGTVSFLAQLTLNLPQSRTASDRRKPWGTLTTAV